MAEGSGALDHVCRWIAALTGARRVQREDQERYDTLGGSSGDVRRQWDEATAAQARVADRLSREADKRNQPKGSR